MGTQHSSPIKFDCVACQSNDNEFASVDWKKQLYRDCESIKDRSKWAKYFLSQVYSGLKSQPIEGYIIQFQSAHQQYKSQFLKNSRKSQSYSNNLNQSIKQSSDNSIKQLIYNTDLTIQQLEVQTNTIINRQEASVSLQVIEKKKISESFDKEDRLLMSQLIYYVDIIKLLKQQISNQDHQLYVILQFFIDSFKRQYNMDRCSKQLDSAVTDLKEFSRVFQQCIQNYYQYEKTQMSTGPVTDLFNRDNMLTAIYSMLFHKDIIYQIIYDMIMEWLRKDVDMLKTAIENCYNHEIDFYDINVKYRLNKSTHSYLLKKYSNCEINYREGIPYQKCFKLLSQIKEKQSPQQKLKALIYCLEKVIKQIKQFYNTYGCEYDFQIESADLISIYMYIIIKSQLFDLQVHLYFIEHFINTNQINYGPYGYYLTSIHAAIKMILLQLH
ncbi:unnamed protein product [Paramecium sonneborni]|uniref:VPS9 domain-containing protein n=1 Tax=Paramecium sonneborni TaxID=65129 RepID=A0A8S1N717_9CILI|nr:unnamed protein product [Paramecium sonneborni]